MLCGLRNLLVPESSAIDDPIVWVTPTTNVRRLAVPMRRLRERF